MGGNLSATNSSSDEEYYDNWEGANQVFAIPNCWQNLAHGTPHWDGMYCTGKTIEWVLFFILCGLLSFLLTLHCLAYKKMNKHWSFLVFKRNRVLVLTLSVLLTGCMFIKLTFMMDYGDLLLLVIAQLLRFLIWSLTLLNFMKSATSLVVNPAIKLVIKWLRILTYIGLAVFIGYGITLMIIKEVTDTTILTCKSREFIVQSAFLLLILGVFHYFAIKVTMELNELIRYQEKNRHDSSEKEAR